MVRSKPIISKLDWKGYLNSNPFCSIFDLLPNEYLSSDGPYVRVSTFVNGTINNNEDYNTVEQTNDDQYFSSDIENEYEPNSKIRKFENLANNKTKTDIPEELDIILF